MIDKLEKQMAVFISTLSAARAGTERDDYLKAYTKALTIAESVISNNVIDRTAYERMTRYVSDCLPWSEEILISWDRVEKLIRKQLALAET